MNIAWCASAFTTFMIGFYIKYIPGDIYTNVIISSLSESTACLVSGVFGVLIGTKWSLSISFLIGGIFGVMLCFIPEENSLMCLTCLLLTKFGVSSSLNLTFLITSEYFPVMYSSQVFAACSLLSRLISIFSPLIAEVPAPIPMMIYGVFCFLSVFGTMFLSKNNLQAEKAMDAALMNASPLNRKLTE